MRIIMEVLGGAIIPLSFFPSILHKSFLCLPFQFMIYFPMRIYLDKLSPSQILLEFLKGGGWIAGLAFLNRAIWKRGVRQYVAMGD